MTAANKLILTAVFAAGLALNANALLITPTSSPRWSGSEPKNIDANDIEDITGTSVDLKLMYKSDFGVGEGGLVGSYETSYSPSDEPEDATITYQTGDFITGAPIYLVVKGGSQEPRWYIFDISGWNGKETIEIQDFWTGQGAISYVGIYSVPDPGSTLALLGLALTSLGLFQRRNLRS